MSTEQYRTPPPDVDDAGLSNDRAPAPPLAWLLSLLQEAMAGVMAGDGTPLQKASAVARLGALYLKTYRTGELEKANRQLARRAAQLEQRVTALEQAPAQRVTATEAAPPPGPPAAAPEPPPVDRESGAGSGASETESVPLVSPVAESTTPLPPRETVFSLPTPLVPGLAAAAGFAGGSGGG